MKGGAWVGWWRTSYPFAELIVTAEQLVLKSGMVGNLYFTKKNLQSMESHTLFPFIAWGIRFKLDNKDYNSKVIFWTLKNPKILLKQIRELGFDLS